MFLRDSEPNHSRRISVVLQWALTWALLISWWRLCEMLCLKCFQILEGRELLPSVVRYLPNGRTQAGFEANKSIYAREEDGSVVSSDEKRGFHLQMFGRFHF